MNKVLFNPIQKDYRNEIGGAKLNAPQFLRIKIAKSESAEGVHIEIHPEFRAVYKLLMKKISEDETYETYEIKYTFIETGLYWYHFSYWNGQKTVYVSKGLRGEAVQLDYPLSWQMTVYQDKPTPDWWKGTNMYQIMVDRFNRAGEIKVRDGAYLHKNWNEDPHYKPIDGIDWNSDFFGGNFKGIEEKLDYIKSLGVDIIYLNPIFEARSNHKYDTDDFEKIDECFGGEKGFRELIDACNERSIKIILDGVFNHVGMDSKYFNKNGYYNTIGASQSKDSPYYPWFSFAKYPVEYESWWGIELLPAVNENNAAYIDYICGDGGIVERYMNMGIGGFRLDVVDELMNIFLDALTKKVKACNPEGIVIGEVWEDASNKIAYGLRRKYFTTGQLDGVMNYPWKNAIIEFIKKADSECLYREIIEIVNNYPKKNLDCLMNILDTHDTRRILTALVGKKRGNNTREEISTWKLTDEERELGKKLLKLATVLQYTLPGVPCLYYGDEAGLEGYRDPFNRRTYPWEKEDDELIEWYKNLGRMRKENPVVKDGEIILGRYIDGIIEYRRKSELGELLVIVNRSRTPYSLEGIYYDYVRDKKVACVKPNSACICKIK